MGEGAATYKTAKGSEKVNDGSVSYLIYEDRNEIRATARKQRRDERRLKERMARRPKDPTSAVHIVESYSLESV